MNKTYQLVASICWFVFCIGKNSPRNLFSLDSCPHVRKNESSPMRCDYINLGYHWREDIWRELVLFLPKVKCGIVRKSPQNLITSGIGSLGQFAQHTPLKTNIFPENLIWLVDVISMWFPFWVHVDFRTCIFLGGEMLFIGCLELDSLMRIFLDEPHGQNFLQMLNERLEIILFS